MDKKLNEIHENLIPTKIKQSYHTLLNTNNKITYLITGQQVPSLIVDTCLHMHYLEHVTMDHIATHTILF